MDFSLLGFQGLRQVFNVHPAFVHFPIALFPEALLFYGLGILLKRRAWCVAGRTCLYLAATGLAMTVATGLMAQDTFPHNERIHHMMLTHRTIGLLAGLTALGLVVWSFAHREQRPRAAWAFLTLLVLTNYLILQNGDLGARMVFVEGAAVKAAIPVITGGHDEERSHHHHGLDEEAQHHHTH